MPHPCCSGAQCRVQPGEDCALGDVGARHQCVLAGAVPARGRMPLHAVRPAHAVCPSLAAACNSRRCTHSFVSLPTAQPCLQTALEAAEAAARAVAEAEEAAALATRLMDAANRYEQQAQDFGHHHHPEGHVSPLDFAEVL